MQKLAARGGPVPTPGLKPSIESGLMTPMAKQTSRNVSGLMSASKNAIKLSPVTGLKTARNSLPANTKQNPLLWPNPTKIGDLHPWPEMAATQIPGANVPIPDPGVQMSAM